MDYEQLYESVGWDDFTKNDWRKLALVALDQAGEREVFLYSAEKMQLVGWWLDILAKATK